MPHVEGDDVAGIEEGVALSLRQRACGGGGGPEEGDGSEEVVPVSHVGEGLRGPLRSPRAPFEGRRERGRRMEGPPGVER